MKQGAKTAIRTVLPAGVRKRIAVWLGRQSWLPKHRFWSVELVADLAKSDPNAYHRFLWTHHMGYAATYEVEKRFGEANIHLSRKMLFDDLVTFLGEKGKDPVRDVRSVLEVGCSMGYLLRYFEETLFPSASVLEGVDIDEYAVRVGTEYLGRIGSKVRLVRADMDNLDRTLGEKRYDLTLGAGVLMYLSREDAAAVVRSMLRHTSGFLVLAGLAHPRVDNRDLEESARRESDGTFIHNLDAMVREGGGEVLFRRWEGPREFDQNTVYFLICSPAIPAPSH